MQEKSSQLEIMELKMIQACRDLNMKKVEGLNRKQLSSTGKRIQLTLKPGL